MTAPGGYDPRYALARIRVLSEDAPPMLVEQRARLARTAEAAGRVLVDASGHGRSRVTLGWPDGHEPPTGDPTCVRRVATMIPLVTLGAAIRACWPDPQQPMLPGQDVHDNDLVAAVQRLAPRTPGGEDSIAAHVKGALVRFRENGYLTSPDDDPQTYRLGPVIAAWTASQINLISRSWSTLPRVPDPVP